MDALVEAIQDVVIAEPETEVQPDQTQPDESAVEMQLTEEINTLWSDHVRLSANRRVTARELRQIRSTLAERLYEMKSLLSRPGRGGQWRSWLREKGINRSTADRLCDRHAETLGIGNAPSEAITEPTVTAAEKLASVVWSRFRKVLVSDEVVIDFINRFAELAGVGHERRAEGLLIFKSVLKAADELPGSVPAIDLIPRSPDEAPAVTEVPKDETAATPTEVGQAAVADAGSGAVL